MAVGSNRLLGYGLLSWWQRPLGVGTILYEPHGGAMRSVRWLVRAAGIMVCATFAAGVAWVSACGGGSSPPPTSAGPGMDGGTIDGALSDMATTTLGRWWGNLPATGADGGALVAMDVTVGAGGLTTENIWFSGISHPTYITAGLGASLAEGGPTVQVDIQLTPATLPVSVTLLRSSARLVHPGAFTVTPLGFSSDGHFFAYAPTVDTQPRGWWGWDANQRERFDLTAGVDAGYPPTSLVDMASGAVSPEGSRSAYCAWRGAGSLTSLFVFDESTASARWVADRASCFAPSIVFSPDGNRLAYFAADADGGMTTLHVWDAGLGSSLDVSSATNAGPPMFTAGGHYLIYSLGGTIPPQPYFIPLYAFDIDTQSTQSLGSARWVSPSADGHYVAFERSDYEVVVWSDSTAAATALDSMRSDSNGNLPMRLAPDGQKVLYQDANLNLRVLVLGQAASSLVASSVTCSTAVGAVPIAVYGTFSEDSTAVGAVAPIAGQCNQGNAPGAVHLFDIASATDHSFPLPSIASALSSGAVLDVSSGAVAYVYSGSGGYHPDIWSPTLGDVSVPVPPSDGSTLYAALGADGNRGVFVLDTGGDPQTAYLWDRTAGTTPLASFSTNPVPPFMAVLDPASGIAIGYDSTKGFVLAKPGSAPTAWVQGANAHLTSVSGKTFAVDGTVGGNSGVFALSFASGADAFLEGGKVLTASDTHVYFIAADGLCEIDVP